ncbi:hypothetical protein HMPREF9176_0592 [Streptococcus downei F0415]|uniref:Uncharacterized protein n=1 Tax=Streptococcus downei MFe28 TaxID=764290 RepID=A0A380JET3_STRDO|nr:hypothetical protein HMPREF9176_0592 [Streptococcus downei F0415]SUN35870.1 Uncharacterised protein [Streptococcus downei MFe28]
MSFGRILCLILAIIFTLLNLTRPLVGGDPAFVWGQVLARVGVPILFYYLAFRKKK